MITISQDFPEITETRNPVLVEGSTDKFTIDEDKGYFEITFNSDPDANDYFRKEMFGMSITFTAKNSPTNSFEFKAYTNNSEWDQMVQDFLDNYYIFRFFDITEDYATRTIRFTEKKGGTTDLKDTVVYVGDQSHTASTGAGIEFRTGYKMVLEVHRQEDPTDPPATDLIGATEIMPEMDDTFSIDSAYLLRNLVKSVRPDLFTLDPVLCADMTAWYWGLFYEEYGSPSVAEDIDVRGSTNSYYRAIHGGIKRRDYAVTGLEYLPNYISNTPNKFLTYMPDKEKIHAKQPMWLYLFVPETVTEINTHWGIYYSDGSSDSGIGFTGDITGNLGEVYCFPIGFEQTGLHLANPTKTPIKYQFNVLDQNNDPCSEQRTYYIEHSPQPEQEYILWENPLGAYDTYWAKGFQIKGARTTSKVEQLLYPMPYQSGPFRNAPTDKFYHLHTRTGILSENASSWLIDILQSPDIMLYDGDNDRFENLTIVTRELPEWNSKESFSAWEIEFELSRTE
jgi:hypothetical protein